jgi:hypothetical protein
MHFKRIDLAQPTGGDRCDDHAIGVLIANIIRDNQRWPRFRYL